MKGKDVDLAVCIYSPLKRDGAKPKCDAGQKYYLTRNPKGLLYGTCCGIGAVGSQWEGAKPACTTSFNTTMPAFSVNSCSGPTIHTKAADIEVCVYVPGGPDGPGAPPQE
jgi:hypothetical protein